MSFLSMANSVPLYAWTSFYFFTHGGHLIYFLLYCDIMLLL